MNYEQFIRKLEEAKIEYTLFHCETAVYVEVGHFGYRFNEQGKSIGGWIRNEEGDWRAEWREWMALLREPI